MTKPKEFSENGLASRRKSATSPYLAYHEITEEEPKYLYAVSSHRFREHVEWLKEFTGEISAANYFITFDDGHITQFRNAFPILEEYSLKATFFITVGWTGKRREYMSWAELQELIQQGHQVQSHGWSHALLTNCSAADLREELIRSKHELQYGLGAPVDAISMPGGRWNNQVLEACKGAGYKRVFTSDPLMHANERQGLSVAGRWMATRTLRAKRIQSYLEGEGAAIYMLRASHFAKAAARRLLGDRAYQSMWRTLSRKRTSKGTMEEISSSQG